MILLIFKRAKFTFFPLVLFVLVFHGCINRVDRVTVEGHLRGIPKTYIYINRFEGDSLAIIDSLKTSFRGYFKIKLNVESPYFVTIGTEKSQVSILLLIQPGEKINIESDGADLKDYKVYGSSGSSVLSDFSNRFNLIKTQIDSINKEYQLNLNSPKIDSIQHRLDSIYQTIISNHHEFAANFIKENPFSLASTLALFQSYDSFHPVFDYAKDRKLFRQTDSSLLSVYSSNRMVKAFHKKLLKLDSLYTLRHKREMMFKEGEILPNVGYPLINNDYLFISSVWYKYALIDFWGDWCNDCNSNNKELKEIYKEYAPKGFVVLQVSLGGIPDSLKSIATRDTITWYQACIPEIRGSRLLDTLRISSIPSSYIIDRWGVVKAVNVNGDSLRLKLKELFPK